MHSVDGEKKTAMHVFLYCW